MEQLKNSMDESYKEAVQEYHFIVVKQLTDLKQQLDESRLRNEALDHTVAVIANKLEQISHGKEDKSQKMIVEQYTMMKGELNKMRIEMDHETQKQNQNLMSEVSTLKKAVVKLEKSKERLEYDYEKKLSHIIKNKDMEIKALHLQLQKQKNELYTSLSIKKQNEVDNIVSILEERYKTLLAETEAMSESKIQEYLMRIAILEDQVLNTKKFESSL
ncbi:myosin heavy chain, clone 203-like [Bombus flavifrons]|uniref:myosin heavy chain, clone 203-like n=1 Tax=Bombus flavifrons TaxID=103934 RepID=UPI0037038C87